MTINVCSASISKSGSYGAIWQVKWDGARSCSSFGETEVIPHSTGAPVTDYIGRLVGGDFIYSGIHYNTDGSEWVDLCTGIVCPTCDEITLETIVSHCENGICIEDSRQLVPESCGYLDQVICIPNWKCNQPLDGTMSDGCGNTQSNSECNIITEPPITELPISTSSDKSYLKPAIYGIIGMLVAKAIIFPDD